MNESSPSARRPDPPLKPRQPPSASSTLPGTETTAAASALQALHAETTAAMDASTVFFETLTPLIAHLGVHSGRAVGPATRGGERPRESDLPEQILPRIEPPPKGVFVVIDIDSGDYEIHERASRPGCG